MRKRGKAINTSSRWSASRPTFTFDLLKQARNAFLDHELSFEVTKEQYEHDGSLWTPHFGVSPLITGHLSQIQGTVVRKWAEDDPTYVEAVLANGNHLVLTREQAAALQR